MKERVNEAIWIEARQRWQINVQRDGERKTLTCATPGTKGKVACEKKADKWLDDQHKKDVRFEVLWKMFLEYTKANTSTSNHAKHEQMGRLWLLPRVKHKRISSITNLDWQKCINDAYKKGLSKKTLTNIRASITAVYRFAKSDKRPMERPEDLKIYDDAPEVERKILQPRDIKVLFSQDSITKYNRQEPCFHINAWRFLVLTGLRPGEMAGLQRGDLQGKLLTIQRSINTYNEITRGKNKNARRTMILTHHAAAVLVAQAEMLKQKGIVTAWLFPGEDGQAIEPQRLYKAWLTYRKQHCIKSSLYEMRHTMVSISKSDVPKPLLKRIVGHSAGMDTFGVYGHDVDGELQRAADILDGVFDDILK